MTDASPRLLRHRLRYSGSSCWGQKLRRLVEPPTPDGLSHLIVTRFSESIRVICGVTSEMEMIESRPRLRCTAGENAIAVSENFYSTHSQSGVRDAGQVPVGIIFVLPNLSSTSLHLGTDTGNFPCPRRIPTPCRTALLIRAFSSPAIFPSYRLLFPHFWSVSPSLALASVPRPEVPAVLQLSLLESWALRLLKPVMVMSMGRDLSPDRKETFCYRFGETDEVSSSRVVVSAS